MKSTRLMWRIAGMAALLSTLLFVFGFVYAVRDVLKPQPGIPAPERQESQTGGTNEPDKLQIVALGDSLTKGYGDTTGEGYVGKVKRELEKSSAKPVFVWNYGVNGIKTADLLKYVSDTGSEIPQSIRKADIVLITIGGNDLFQLSQTQTSSAQSFELDYANVRQKMPEALQRLGQIMAKVAELNPNASILYVGLYHPFLDFDQTREGVKLLGEWNSKAAALASQYPHVTVVPTYDLFEKNLNKYLYTDHFHPNEEGYARIASRVVQVLQ